MPDQGSLSTSVLDHSARSTVPAAAPGRLVISEIPDLLQSPLRAIDATVSPTQESKSTTSARLSAFSSSI